MKHRIIPLVTISVLIIIAAVLILKFNFFPSKTNPNKKPSNDAVASSYYVPINSGDNEELKTKKEKYNELVKQSANIVAEYDKKMRNRTITSQEIQNYKEQSELLYEQMQALGINPDDYKSSKQKYEENYEGYVCDNEMFLSEYTDKNGRVIPQYAKDYEMYLKRKQYLESVKHKYDQGKISAEEALKSFTEQNNIK